MKKGFTLVELLVVIVILGLLALVAYPSIIKIINDSKDDALKNQKLVLEKITKEWAVEHPMELPEIKENNGICSCDSEKKCIPIEELINEGYLSDEEVKNPKGGKLDGGIEITCSCDNSCNTCKYEYKYIEKDTCDSEKN